MRRAKSWPGMVGCESARKRDTRGHQGVWSEERSVEIGDARSEVRAGWSVDQTRQRDGSEESMLERGCRDVEEILACGIVRMESTWEI